MRLVLQCTLCGTVQPVGSAICGTCRASGVENLRLMFECQHCFRLGLNPSCDLCSHFLSLDDDGSDATARIRAAATDLDDSDLDDEILAEEVLEAELLDEDLDDLDSDLDTDFAGRAKGTASVFDLPREGFLAAGVDDDELEDDAEAHHAGD
jgi:hypothetical protein